MSLKAKLSRCHNLQDFSKFLDALSSESLKVDKKTLTHEKTQDAIDIGRIVNRLIDIYNNMPDDKQKTHVKDVAGIIFQFQQSFLSNYNLNIFDKFSAINRVFQYCIMQIRQDKKTMQTVIGNFNRLAEKINAKKQQSQWADASQEHNNKQDLHQVRFLNEILKIKLEPQHFTGELNIPTAGHHETQTTSKTTNLSLSDCHSIGALQRLAHTLVRNITTIEGNAIKVHGHGVVNVDKLEHKLKDLYQEAIKLDPYIKSDLAFHTLSIINTLNKLMPGYEKQMPTEIKRIYYEAIQTIKSDTKLMRKVSTEYNKLIGRLNKDLFSNATWRGMPSLSETATLTASDQNIIDRIHFLNQFLNMPMTHMHLQGRAFFLPHNIASVEKSLDYSMQYNRLAVILNLEHRLQSLNQRRGELTFELDPQNNSLQLKDIVEIKALQEELGQINSQLEALDEKPYPKAFLDSMHKFANHLAKNLSIKLTAQQQKGNKPLPVIGKDISLDYKVNDLLVDKPRKYTKWNRYIRMINYQRAYKNKKLEYAEFHRKAIDEKGFGEAVDLLDEVYPVHEELIGEIEAAKFPRDKEFFFVPGERINLNRLAEMLRLNDEFHFADWNTRDITRDDPLPLIDIEAIPYPGTDAIAQRLKEVNPQDAARAIEAWPQSWLKHWPEIEVNDQIQDSGMNFSGPK